MRRPPAVAHQFYPGDSATLRKTVAELTPEIAENRKINALAVITPHAGYIYSGAVAGETIAISRIPANVILLGPNHHGQGAPVALMASGSWQMPMGDVPINEELSAILMRNSPIIHNDSLAHRLEHSLEVEVPFLQYSQPHLTLAPLVISHLPLDTCMQLGKDIAAAIGQYGKPVLIVASSDMTHYESRQEASRKDRLAMDCIENLDPEGLYRTVNEKRITMCGIMPATIALAAAVELGAKRAELIRYTDSGETSGDTDHVVGYAGFIIS
ncbi:MAG TPA: AmmeMemoRadiSam system protein B [Deltaproteobacteria bacterium]|nr:AmmeMemoRadiSam system protein B [Deltaproteobacteria bacterium]